MSGNNCATILRLIQEWSIPQFAARWCDVPPEEVDSFLAKSPPVCTTNKKAALLHQNPDCLCLKPKIDFIIKAIEEGRLEVCDDAGRFRKVEEMSWERMRIRHNKARVWLENSALPVDDLPNFIFHDDSYLARPQAEVLDAAQQRIKQLEEELQAAKKELEEVRKQVVSIENNGSTVNAEKWRLSCTALAKAYAHLMQGCGNGNNWNSEKETFVKDEFIAFLKKRVEEFQDILYTVEEIAWKELPQDFKNALGVLEKKKK